MLGRFGSGLRGVVFRLSDSARMNFRRWGVVEWMWFGSDGSGGCCFGSRWSGDASEAGMIGFSCFSDWIFLKFSSLFV